MLVWLNHRVILDINNNNNNQLYKDNIQELILIKAIMGNKINRQFKTKTKTNSNSNSKSNKVNLSNFNLCLKHNSNNNNQTLTIHLNNLQINQVVTK